MYGINEYLENPYMFKVYHKMFHKGPLIKPIITKSLLLPKSGILIHF
jgi:hypothetical protein